MLQLVSNYYFEVFMTYKRTILIDLDGVLNNYTGGYQEDFIPEIREGAREFIKGLYEEGFDLKLFTTRPSNLAQKWLEKNALSEYFSEATNIKKTAWLILDDRCINFNGNYPQTAEKIKNFKPWYR